MTPPAPSNRASDERRRIYNQMYAELIALAKARETITYSELARHLGIHHRHPAFMQILGDICTEEEAEGRGMLCALVVAKSTGIPGGGFFAGAANHGRDTSNINQAWKDECELVFGAWADADEHAAL